MKQASTRDKNPVCVECGRPAKAFVTRKPPAAGKIHKWFCGYHLRAYDTSEFRKTPVMQTKFPKPKRLGYAPVGAI